MFSQYIFQLRYATSRNSAWDIKICSERSAFYAAWQPLDMSQIIAADAKRCMEDTVRRKENTHVQCVQTVKPSKEVQLKLLNLPRL